MTETEHDRILKLRGDLRKKAEKIEELRERVRVLERVLDQAEKILGWVRLCYVGSTSESDEKTGWGLASEGTCLSLPGTSPPSTVFQGLEILAREQEDENVDTERS